MDDGTGWKPVPAPPPQSQVAIDPQLLQAVRDGMWLVVNGSGTGARARIAGHDVVGKTGTAQVISNEAKAALAGKSTRDLRDHGLFVFFAPRDHPTIAGVVVAEQGSVLLDGRDPLAMSALEAAGIECVMRRDDCGVA